MAGREGVPFTFGRSLGAEVRDGVLQVLPGQVLQTSGEGLLRGYEMFEPLPRHAEQIGIEIRWSTPLADVIQDDGRITGVVVGASTIESDSVVIASGGFQADPDLRRKHLGPALAAAVLGGTRYSTGDGIFAALRAGADKAGAWSNCHSAAVDANMPSPLRSDEDPPAPLHGFWLGVLNQSRGRTVRRRGARAVGQELLEDGKGHHASAQQRCVRSLRSVCSGPRCQ